VNNPVITPAIEATRQLGAWAASLDWDDVPQAEQDRLSLILIDTLGVMAVGAREPEQQRLVTAWRPPPGSAPVVGANLLTTVEAAAWLNATALVRLELDEGHKYAKGHPAAHGFPAVLALAADTNATGPDTMAALVACYEVAARFGRATRLRPGAHPHGSWGVAGAAAGCARLLALRPDQVAAAIDTGAGMPIAGHFSSALDGNPVRDAWMSASNLSGIAAARMAAADIARNTGTAALSLGQLLGEFDSSELTDALGERWDLSSGYFKRHASCSFTHPAADAALAIREAMTPAQVASIDEIRIETHSLAAELGRTEWDERLSALFSMPFVVAAALHHGNVSPAVSTEEQLQNPEVRALAAKVTVVMSDELDARLPDERAARVTIRFGETKQVVEVPNPIGDSAYHPLGESEVLSLLHSLLPGDGAVETIRSVVKELPSSHEARQLLQQLAVI
jgi:2-methylcitrate dehydratase PrpD